MFWSLTPSNVHLTCVDELDMALQVAVYHEDLVAARVRAGSLSHLLVMLFDVLLKRPMESNKPSENYPFPF